MNQKAKNIIKYVILSAIIIVGAYFYSFVKTATEAGSEFTCVGSRLYCVAVDMSTMDINAESDIVFSLYNEDKEVVTIAEKASEIDTTDPMEFDFTKIQDSRGCQYRVELTIDGKAQENLALKYYSICFRLQTMIVFIICMAYLVGLSIMLRKLFRR